MPTLSTRRLAALLALALLPSSLAFAQAPAPKVAPPAAAAPPAKAAPPKSAPPKSAGPKIDVKRETLKIPGGAKATASRAHMMSTSREVARGYYNALIAAKYDEAASFLHPSAIEPLRTRVLEDLEKSPGKKTENTLAALGVKDLTTLRTMSLDAFYVAWAKSSYGAGIQVLASKDLAVDVVLDPPVCSQPKRVCEVNVKLRGRNEAGEKMETPNTVFVVEHQGRWLLTLKPPA